MTMISNIVKKDIVREVQHETLREIQGALLPSFGPMGSTTNIDVKDKLNCYSKDGHTILKHLSFKDPIECRVRDDLEEVTRYIVQKVGYSGKYPVWGYEHMYTKGEATGAVKAFLDFIMSDEYGKDIEAQGYGVTAKMKVQR